MGYIQEELVIEYQASMPFLSVDWRGPGEDWVKCQDGWETRKVAQASGAGSERGSSRRRRYQTEPGTPAHSTKGETDGDKENADTSNQPARLERHRSLPVLQPFCPITIKCTKEVAGFNTLSDVLKRLDFRSAVHDIRRFHYVSSLLRLLLSPDKLFQLPGASQKIIFRILEEMAVAVFAEQRGEHVLKKLLQDLHCALEERRVWGSHHGSESLRHGHNAARRRIACIAALEQRKIVEERRMAVKEEGSSSSLEQLPEECVREVLLRLSDSKDIITAGKVMPSMALIVSEKRIWRELVQAHFTSLQIEFMLNSKPALKEKKNWAELYAALKRHFGLKQEFTELVMLCKPCRVLFWQSYGHPCMLEDEATVDKRELGKNWLPLTPATFLTFFSI